MSLIGSGSGKSDLSEDAYNKMKEWFKHKLSKKDYVGNFYYHKKKKGQGSSKLIAYLFLR